jgi:ribonuclease BN (tRNA processing enzyme)
VAGRMSTHRGTVTDADAGEARGFEVVVLGSAGTRPGAGQVCSGYLFRTPSARVVADLGYGSSSTLYHIVAAGEIDAIVLSHRHADHCVDLVGLYYAMRFHPDGPLSVDVYAPPGTGEFMSGMVGDNSEPAFRDLCRFHEVGAGDRLRFGDIDVEVHDSIHVVPSISVRVEHNGRVVTYSGDSAGGDPLVTAARDADLFICEASWLGSPDDYDDGIHLTASGAGQVAQDAGVGHLLLTHIWPDNDLDRSVREASETFAGPIGIAKDGDIWAVGG